MVSIRDHHHDGGVSSLYIQPLVDGFGCKLYFSILMRENTMGVRLFHANFDRGVVSSLVNKCVMSHSSLFAFSMKGTSIALTRERQSRKFDFNEIIFIIFCLKMRFDLTSLRLRDTKYE